ncbi:hypothetical protein Bbelb_299240 [Branchiostoma belcheri]|nr:hypothetical protein Bbelb_299240 [Branchiostoma belcheri]
MTLTALKRPSTPQTSAIRQTYEQLAATLLGQLLAFYTFRAHTSTERTKSALHPQVCSVALLWSAHTAHMTWWVVYGSLRTASDRRVIRTKEQETPALYVREYWLPSLITGDVD